MAKYTLELSFDTQQATQTLAYRFMKGSARHSRKSHGLLGGTYNFEHSDEVSVKLVAASNVDFDFSITDCTLVFIKEPRFQALSLFDPDKACIQVSDWGTPKKVSGPGGTKAYQVETRNPLKVNYETEGAKSAAWKMSGYLSIIIRKDGGSDVPYFYHFDPETSGGTGAGMGQNMP